LHLSLLPRFYPLFFLRFLFISFFFIPLLIPVPIFYHPYHPSFSTSILDFRNLHAPLPATKFLPGYFDDTINPRHYLRRLEDKEKWEVAKTWGREACFERRYQTGPSTISGISRLRDLAELASLLCPHMLGHPLMIERVPVQMQEKRRAENEGKIVGTLEKHDS
jgi:hypothetical protein